MVHKFEVQKGDESRTVKENIERRILESPYVKYLEKDDPKNGMLPWLKIVQVVEAEKLTETTARMVFRFPVQHEYLNPGMTLHGGLSAGIFDTATTWLLDAVRKPGFWMSFGTTRSLSLTYIRPAIEGEMLRLECEIVHAGKKLCLMRAVLMREKDRAIITTCEHEKYNNDASKI